MPLPHAWLMMLEMRMCSRLDSGSASMPTRPRIDDANPSISSATVSGSSVAGERSEPITLRGMPALEPGV